MSFFEAIDIFDKSKNDDLRLTTKASSILSYVISFIGISLLIGFIISIMKPKLIRDLSLKTTLLDEQEPVNVSLAIVVNMPCYFIHLDVVDSIGFDQLDINTTAKMQRMDSSRKIIGLANVTLGSECMSCYGLLPEGQCCNSCEQIILLHMIHGKSVAPKELPQCNGKKNYNVSPNEKCYIKGKVVLNKVSGNFHIGLGSNKASNGGHVHDLSAQFPTYDLSHTINSMRVGPKIPLTYNPLGQFVQRQNPSLPMVYRYTMIVTPAEYQISKKQSRRGYDYTAMADRHIARQGEAPGIYFHYSFTPYGVTVRRTDGGFFQTFTSLIGLFSGFYALFSLLDRGAEVHQENAKERKNKMEKDAQPQTAQAEPAK